MTNEDPFDIALDNADKAVGCGIFGHFSNFDKCRPEVAGEVVSGTALDYVGLDVPVKCGDSKSNGSRDIRRAWLISCRPTIEDNHIRAKRLRFFA